jgi:uncharacterized coiled-coil DUF342 family protein
MDDYEDLPNTNGSKLDRILSKLDDAREGRGAMNEKLDDISRDLASHRAEFAKHDGEDREFRKATERRVDKLERKSETDMRERLNQEREAAKGVTADKKDSSKHWTRTIAAVAIGIVASVIAAVITAIVTGHVK